MTALRLLSVDPCATRVGVSLSGTTDTLAGGTAGLPDPSRSQPWRYPAAVAGLLWRRLTHWPGPERAQCGTFRRLRPVASEAVVMCLVLFGCTTGPDTTAWPTVAGCGVLSTGLAVAAAMARSARPAFSDRQGRCLRPSASAHEMRVPRRAVMTSVGRAVMTSVGRAVMTSAGER